MVIHYPHYNRELGVRRDWNPAGHFHVEDVDAGQLCVLGSGHTA